jgi:putative endonuclease
MLEKQYYVYIMTTKNNTTLYTGVTNDLMRRAHEHKNHLIYGFSRRYNTERLVYYEVSEDINSAIAREKQIKSWLRKKKVALIESMNPEWHDLYDKLMEG